MNVESLSLPELLGQMMIISVNGTKLIDETKDLIRELHLGGIIFFKENYVNRNQLRRFCKELQETAQNTINSIPLFISVDQEGGRIIRLNAPFTQIPSAQKIGQRGAEYAYEIASIAARELRQVGINMDHAPVLDINTNKNNPIIGERSFGNDPKTVAKIGEAFFKGLQDHGIISTGKHFPGHGDTEADSHLILPVVAHKLARFNEVEFYPFKNAIEKGIETIMTAHISYPKLDEGYPASLSEKIVKDILRKQLGFEGIIITDDLSMKAITFKYNLEQACYLALKAGASILLICHQNYDVYKEIYHKLINRLEDAPSLMTYIKREVKRIIRLKEKYLTSWK